MRERSITITTPTAANAHHGVDLGLDPARQPGHCEDADAEAEQASTPALRERGEVLRLAVAVLVPDVGGTCRDTDCEERQQRRHEVRARVHRLGDQAERPRPDPGMSLIAIRAVAATTDTSAVRRCGDMREGY